MFERQAALIACRAFLVAVVLASVSGCNIPEPPAEPVAAVPVNLAATGGISSVTLTWTLSTGATAYNVKRATSNGGPYTRVASPTSNSYTDTSVTNGTAYYYVVSALNVAGESSNSSQATATPVALTIPPAPAGLVATGDAAQLTLTWNASTGATSYRLKRALVSGGPYTQVAAPTVTSYVDTPLTNGTTYYYVVSAVNAAGESANSAQAFGIPSPGPPTTLGTWINVTPAGVSIPTPSGCDAGSSTVQKDPVRPSNLYASFDCQGIWKSTDFGASWTGPINTGTNGTAISDCQGGIRISPTSTANVPTIFLTCIRGSIGFWKSVDAGVSWTRYNVAPGGSRQDYFGAVVDPYDPNHLLMTGHELDSTVESVDGGQTWTNVPLASGMLQSAINNGSGFIFFVDTGVANTTRGTWLWIGDTSGGVIGTWRTVNSGATWVKVDKNEHPGGSAQIYQPDTGGVIYMAGINSDLGKGVLRSSDYGQTWIHVGLPDNEDTIVFGTPKNLYALYGISPNPHYQVGSQPGAGRWIAPTLPAGLRSGAQVAVVNDGVNNILVGAMWESGVWRYVEP